MNMRRSRRLVDEYRIVEASRRENGSLAPRFSSVLTATPPKSLVKLTMAIKHSSS